MPLRTGHLHAGQRRPVPALPGRHALPQGQQRGQQGLPVRSEQERGAGIPEAQGRPLVLCVGAP
eukprot:14256989-Alexandrium_andersonii.AAC.1